MNSKCNYKLAAHCKINIIYIYLWIRQYTRICHPHKEMLHPPDSWSFDTLINLILLINKANSFLQVSYHHSIRSHYKAVRSTFMVWGLWVTSAWSIVHLTNEQLQEIKQQQQPPIALFQDQQAIHFTKLNVKRWFGIYAVKKNKFDERKAQLTKSIWRCTKFMWNDVICCPCFPMKWGLISRYAL